KIICRPELAGYPMQNCAAVWRNWSHRCRVAAPFVHLAQVKLKISRLMKKSVATFADIPDRSPLYAKTSHPHICHPGTRGNLPASRNGAAILGADSKV